MRSSSRSHRADDGTSLPLSTLSHLARVALVVASLASPLFAQPGGMGGRGGMPPGGMGRGGAPAARSAPRFANAKDIEEFNPAAHLVDKRRKLKLTTTEVDSLTEVAQRIYVRNVPLLVRYDSLRKEFKPPTAANAPGGGRGGPPGGGMGGPGGGGGQGAPAGGDPAQMEKMRAQMTAMRDVLEQLDRRRATDVADALAVVGAERRSAARALLDKQDEKFRRLIPAPQDGGDREPGRPGSPRPDC